MYYLDVILIVNGAMDAVLLIFTAHLLRKKSSWFRIFLAVLLGEVPVFFVLFDLALWEALSKVLIPLAMVAIGLQVKSIRELVKGLIIFSLLASVSGGIYYALSGWLGLTGGEGTFLALQDLWFLPLTVFVLVGGYGFWEKIQKTNLFLDHVLYDAELCFENNLSLKIKALLDTGNELRDPLTGTPVMLLEETIAQKVMPEKIQQFLQLPWRESANPWSYIWNDEEYSYQRMVFISAKGINGQTWLPGIRLGKVKISQGKREWEQPVTVALVPQTLSSDNRFQALLHPEHIHKPANKEGIA